MQSRRSLGFGNWRAERHDGRIFLPANVTRLHTFSRAFKGFTVAVSAQLHLVEPYQPTPDDIKRELKLQDCLQRIQQARTPTMKRRYWNKYTSLHNQRGLEYVRYLEVKKGIYRG